MSLRRRHLIQTLKLLLLNVLHTMFLIFYYSVAADKLVALWNKCKQLEFAKMGLVIYINSQTTMYRTFCEMVLEPGNLKSA